MKPAAIGVRAHSGWAAVVAVAGDLRAPEVLARRRVSVVEPDAHGARQPYHYARDLTLDDAKSHLAHCKKVGCRLATAGLRAIVKDAAASRYEIVCCGILAASGRPTPGLEQILASHPMVHTAEGEFFRDAFAGACDRLKLPFSKVRERELFDSAAEQLHIPPAKIKSRLKKVGLDLGPPWTQDQKSAALVAWLLLSEAVS